VKPEISSLSFDQISLKQHYCLNTKALAMQGLFCACFFWENYIKLTA
jgi:hypothetical protein